MTAQALSARPARWPWIVLAIFLLIAFAGTALVAPNGEPIVTQVPFIVAFSMFGVVGALILSRDRGNLIGVLLMFGAVMTAISLLGGELTTWLITHGHEGPFVVLLGFMNNFGWSLGIISVVLLLPLLFPDGHLPSPRWRPFLWAVVAFLVVLNVSLLIGQRTLTGSSMNAEIANPFYVSATAHWPNMDVVVAIVLPFLFAGSVASVFVRYRRAVGIERQQIRWVAFGLLAAFISIIVSFFLPSDSLLSAVIAGAGFLAFPVSIGVAVLRFRLYELDVVVKKTVVYAALGLFATAVYLALVVGLGAWLGRGSSFLTMVAAVVVAVTFQPARARLTRFANRLVYGERATPYQVLSEFSERVGEAYADEDVLPRMARVLAEGIGAERADVWLAFDRELRDVASWPSDAAVQRPVAVANGGLPAIVGADRVVPVERAGELLGALAVRKPANDPVDPSDERLIGDLAGQAGLVLRNVRLSEELRARLEDLKAAQKRLVAAQDEERRRLERDIHDGAQQQLVAMAVQLRLAQTLTRQDPERAQAMLGRLGEAAGQALEDLRDLARGIYPPLLADKGLVAALEAQTRKITVPVEVRAVDIGRYPQGIEAAVYFSVLEGLQNVSKYADASRVVVTLTQRDGQLRFEVSDDGRGFDPASSRRGSGLQGMADRLAALDGTIEIRSAPGTGTTIAGRVPIAEHEMVDAT